MSIHHVFKSSYMACMEIPDPNISSIDLFEIRTYIRIKCDFMSQPQLLFFQNWRLLWHGVQKQDDKPIKMAGGDKSGVRDLLILLIPIPQL